MKTPAQIIETIDEAAADLSTYCAYAPLGSTEADFRHALEALSAMRRAQRALEGITENKYRTHEEVQADERKKAERKNEAQPTA